MNSYRSGGPGLEPVQFRLQCDKPYPVVQVQRRNSIEIMFSERNLHLESLSLEVIQFQF